MTNITKYNPVSDKVIVSETTGTKLRNADNKTIKVMVVKIMVIFGFGANAIPSDNDELGLPRATYLFQLIKETLGEWTDEEVIYAMKLASIKQINANTKLYDGQLNIAFFGEIMDSYRQYKREHKQSIQYLLPETASELTDKEKKTIILNSFLLHFTEYCKTRQLIDLGGVNFSFAERNNLFTKFDIPTDLEALYQKANYLYKDRQEDTLTRTISWIKKDAIRFSIENIDKQSGDFTRIVKELQLKNLYNHWININLSKEQILKSLNNE